MKHEDGLMVAFVVRHSTSAKLKHASIMMVFLSNEDASFNEIAAGSEQSPVRGL
jgi:hypothetical protein